MLRRVITLVAGGVLSLAVATPAQATVVDQTFGPLSIGDYCYSNVHTSAFIGFYEGGGLRCYSRGPSGNLQYVGAGNPYQACDYLTTGTVITSWRGPSDSLVCRVDQ